MNFHNSRYRYLIMLPAVTFVMAGCSTNQQKQLGAPVSNASMVTIDKLVGTHGIVQIKGKMIDKCPTAACWMHVKDSSGAIKVDMKYSGFTVADIPVNSEITVTGSYTDGDDKHFTAVGIVY